MSTGLEGNCEWNKLFFQSRQAYEQIHLTAPNTAAQSAIAEGTIANLKKENDDLTAQVTYITKRKDMWKNG